MNVMRKASKAKWAVLLLSGLALSACADQNGDDGLPRVHDGELECGQSAARISAIQGDGPLSPVIGREVEVEGIVSARFIDGLGGFYLQSLADQVDQNPATSEGLFVRHAELPRLPKHARIRLRGMVAELGEAPVTTTALIEVSALIRCGEPEKLAPIVLQKAPDSMAGWESLEGQWVRIPGPLSVVGNENLLRNGELLASFDGRDFVATERSAPGLAAEAISNDNLRTRILLDDGQLNTYPRKLWYLPEPLTAETPWRVDTQLNGVEGVLDQRDGVWRLQLTRAIESAKQAPRPETPPELDGDLRIASFNVLNYFNGDGKGGGFPTARGADSPLAFKRQRQKIISALSKIQPDILALMEIENDGFGPESAIADLTQGLNDAMPADARDYQFVSVDAGVLGTDSISVGLLYRNTRVAPVGAPALLSEGPFEVVGRPSLAQTFAVDDLRFTIVANHFKSKGSCDPTDGPNHDQGDGQGCWNALRVAQANNLWSWLETDPTASGARKFLALGDFNSYGEEDPIRVLKARGMVDVLAENAAEPTYSYVFRGESGRLDHALASADLVPLISHAAEWHINGDESPAFEYGSAGFDAQSLRARFRPDPFRSSDHDPVLIGLHLPNSKPASAPEPAPQTPPDAVKPKD